MEKDRKKISGRFVDIGTTPERGFSNISITASLALIVLLATTVWQSHVKIEDQETSLSFVKTQDVGAENTIDPDVVYVDQLIAELSRSNSSSTPTHIGPAVLDQLATSYANLKASGEYTPEAGRQLGLSMGPMIQTELNVKRYSREDFVVQSDISKEAAAAYQSALYDAFEPLRQNQTLEFEYFGRYIETKDKKYLTELRNVADLYHAAAGNMQKISTPSDVVSYAIALANSLNEFGTVLGALAEHADDPVGSVALLRSYNSAEQGVLNNYNALRLYHVNKLK